MCPKHRDSTMISMEDFTIYHIAFAPKPVPSDEVSNATVCELVYTSQTIGIGMSILYFE